MRHFLLLLLAFCLPVAAFGQAYRWVDAQGQVHYSQTPPPGQQGTTYIAPPHPPSANPNQETLNKSLQDAARAEPGLKKQAADAAADQAKRDAQCTDVNNQVATMNSQTAQRLRVTQEQFLARRQELEQFLAQNCR